MTLIRMLALLLIVSTGWAQESPDVLNLAKTPRFTGTFAGCEDAFQPSATVQNPWQYLDRMSLTDRSNSFLSVDLAPQAPLSAHHAALETEALWNAGDYAGAIQRMHDLSLIVPPSEIEMGFQWKHPLTSTCNTLVPPNIRIGEMDSVSSISLAANGDASRIFCIVSQSGDGLAGGWHLFLSTNKGATWENTYTQSGTGNAPKNALMVTDSTTYVAYLPYFTLQRLRLKPFHTSNGTPATVVGGASYRDVRTLTGSETFREVAACAGKIGSVQVCNLVVSTSTNHARFFTTIWPKDTTWNEIVDSSAVAVSGGLTIAFGSTPTDAACYIAYVDTNGNACVDTLHQGPGRFRRSWSRENANGITSLGAYGDTVLCAYDHYAGGTQHVMYFMNYDGGEGNWRFSSFQDTSLTSTTPVVSCEMGQGLGVFYRHNTGSEWLGRFGYRTYPLGSIWATPTRITDYVPSTIRPAIIAMGDNTWGIAYVTADTGSTYRAVMFAIHHVVPTAVTEGTSTAPVAFALEQNWPNPFNPRTTIGIRQQAVGSRWMKLAVYDLLGREVAVLVDEQKHPGEYTATWDAHGMASGMYYYRLMAGGASETKKMLLLR